MKIHIIILLSAIMLSMCTTNALGANVITNGDFESFDGWILIDYPLGPFGVNTSLNYVNDWTPNYNGAYGNCNTSTRDISGIHSFSCGVADCPIQFTGTHCFEFKPYDALNGNMTINSNTFTAVSSSGMLSLYAYKKDDLVTPNQSYWAWSAYDTNGTVIINQENIAYDTRPALKYYNFNITNLTIGNQYFLSILGRSIGEYLEPSWIDNVSVEMVSPPSPPSGITTHTVTYIGTGCALWGPPNLIDYIVSWAMCNLLALGITACILTIAAGIYLQFRGKGGS